MTEKLLLTYLPKEGKTDLGVPSQEAVMRVLEALAIDEIAEELRRSMERPLRYVDAKNEINFRIVGETKRWRENPQFIRLNTVGKSSSAYYRYKFYKRVAPDWLEGVDGEEVGNSVVANEHYSRMTVTLLSVSSVLIILSATFSLSINWGEPAPPSLPAVITIVLAALSGYIGFSRAQTERKFCNERRWHYR